MLGLGPVISASGGAVPVVVALPETTATAVTITPLTYDQWVYDVGAGRGENAAALPVSGTATGEGAAIYARAVRADTGAAATSYQEIATVSGAAFSGHVSCPKSPHNLRIEVLQAGGSTVLSDAAKRYVAGHRLAAWGQSWFNGLFDFSEAVAYNTTLPHGDYPVANGDTLQIIGQVVSATLATTPNPERRFVRNDALINDQVARLSNYLNEIAPNDRFCIVSQARAATGIVDFMDDSASPTTERDWALDDEPVHDFALTDGAAVGAVLLDWYHNPATAHRDNADLFHLFLFSTLADGTPMQSSAAAGSAQTWVGIEQTYTFDRSLADIYDWTDVRLILNGPNRHENSNIDREGQPENPAAWTYDADPGQNSLTTSTWAPNPAALGREQVRAAYEALADHPAVVRTGLQLNHVACNPVDEQHPTPTYGGTEDGDAAFERATAGAILEALGYTPEVVVADQPRVASITYETDAIVVSFENDAGPVDVITTRLLRGETQDPARPAHHTQVAGFEVAGFPVASATVVDGKVRIGPLGGAPTVTANDFGLQFGRGLGAGQLGHIEDLTLDLWKEFPGWAKPGLSANAEGARIVPARVPARFDAITATNIPDVAPGVSVRSDASSYFTSPGTLSAMLYGRYSGDNEVVRAGTIEFRGAIPVFANTDSSNYLFQMSSGPGLRVDTRTTKRELISSGLGTLRSGTGGYVADTVDTFRLSWDADAGTVWLANGSQVWSVAWAGTGVEMNTLSVMNFSNRTGLTMEHFKMWDSATGDGSAPAGAPILCISGGPSYTNVHPWRVGADFT